MVVGMYDIMAVTRNRIGTGSAACGRWGTKRDPGLRICLNTGWSIRIQMQAGEVFRRRNRGTAFVEASSSIGNLSSFHSVSHKSNPKNKFRWVNRRSTSSFMFDKNNLQRSVVSSSLTCFQNKSRQWKLVGRTRREGNPHNESRDGSSITICRSLAPVFDGVMRDTYSVISAGSQSGISLTAHSLWSSILAVLPVEVATARFENVFAETASAIKFSIPGIVGDQNLFREGFTQSLLLILFSELGDKTFFIAILLATQRSRTSVFAGTFGALAAMSFVSVGLGRFVHLIDEQIPFSIENFDDYLAVLLLFFFGVQTLTSALNDSDENDEEKDAEDAVKAFDPDEGVALILSTFALVFAAEWGDKSFLATIALAASSSPSGVVAGAITGHGFATALAVVGGSFLGAYVSEKVVSLTGGILFIVFAIATLVDI